LKRRGEEVERIRDVTPQRKPTDLHSIYHQPSAAKQGIVERRLPMAFVPTGWRLSVNRRKRGNLAAVEPNHDDSCWGLTVRETWSGFEVSPESDGWKTKELNLPATEVWLPLERFDEEGTQRVVNP